MAEAEHAGGPPGPHSSQEKRKSRRIPVSSDLVGEVMAFQPMTVTEISRGGLKVDTAFALHLDSVHEFRLTLHGHSIVLKGRVVHCRISQVTDGAVKYRSGIQFIDTPERAAGVIGEFVESVARSGTATAP